MRRVLALLAIVTVAGGVLRFQAAADRGTFQSADEQSYARIARSLVSQRQYGTSQMNDPVHWVPGAPLLFATAYAFDRTKRGDGIYDVPAAYDWQAAVGTLTIPAAFWLCLLLAGRWAALAGATLVAFYAPLITASSDLLSEPLGALLVTLGLAMTLWGLEADPAHAPPTAAPEPDGRAPPDRPAAVAATAGAAPADAPRASAAPAAQATQASEGATGAAPAAQATQASEVAAGAAAAVTAPRASAGGSVAAAAVTATPAPVGGSVAAPARGAGGGAGAWSRAWARVPGLRTSRPRRLLAAGVLLGAAILTRADLALLPAFAVVVAALTGALGVAVARRDGAGRLERVRAGVTDRDRLRRGAAFGLPVLLGTVLIVSPWTIFATSKSGHFTALSSGGGSNLFLGTYLPADGSIYKAKFKLYPEIVAYFPGAAKKRPNQVNATDMLKAVAHRRPNERPQDALSAEGRENLRRYVLHQPIDFGAMMARKAWRLWGQPTTGSFRNVRTATRWWHRTLVFLGLLGLTAGLVLTRRPGLWLVAALVAYVTLLNAVLISEPRHNLAVMPALICAGLAGGVLAVQAVLRRRRGAPRTPAVPAAPMAPSAG